MDFRIISLPSFTAVTSGPDPQFHQRACWDGSTSFSAA